MLNHRLINTKVAGGGGGCTDIVDNYDPFDDSSGLALYQLNGNAFDSSPNNYDAASTTGITWGTAGVFDTAASYNGSSSTIQLPDNLSVATGSNNFTLSAWVYLDNFTSPFTSVITTQANWYFYVIIAPDGQVRTSNNVVPLDSPTGVISTGQWYHIVATLSSTSGKNVYVNGSNVATSSDTSNCVDRSGSEGDNALGYYKSTITTSYYLDGKIDQVRVFNRALDPLEVEALYTEELCICDGTVDTLQVLGGGDTSCIATYQLDGNANDLSGQYSGEATDVSYGVGEFDLAGVFNGSSSAIVVPHNSAFNTSNSFSISTWLNRTDNSERIVAYKGTGAGQAWFLNYSNTHGYYFYDYGTTSYVRTGTGVTSTGVWENVILTWDSVSKTPNIYINTIDQSNTQVIRDGSGTTTTADFNIGSAMSYTGMIAWNGSIDQVRIFNKALDQNDVDILFAETACTKAACTGTTHTLNILGGGDTSCIAAYPLDGSPADLSGNYNGVQTNVTYPQGEFDLAAAFPNGTNSKIILPIAESFFSTNSQSVSLWVKMHSLAGGVSQVGGYAFGQEGRWTIHIYQGSFSFINFDSVNRSQEVSYNTTINLGQWYHIVAIKDKSSGMKIYVDNVLRDSNSYTTDIDTTNGVGMGYYESNSARDGFYGEIDQVRIFNKALNSTEVGILFNDETPCN